MNHDLLLMPALLEAVETEYSEKSTVEVNKRSYTDTPWQWLTDREQKARESSEFSIFEDESLLISEDEYLEDEYINNLIDKLKGIAPGQEQWRDYQELGVEIFNYLFVPDLLYQPYEQWCLDADGIFDTPSSKRPDAIYPIVSDRFMQGKWEKLFSSACLFLVVDFKNLCEPPKSKEVEQVANYLSDKARRKIGLLCSREKPSKSAFQARYNVWDKQENLVLFVSDEDIKEMIKLRYDKLDPSIVLTKQMYRFLSKLS